MKLQKKSQKTKIAKRPRVRHIVHLEVTLLLKPLHMVYNLKGYCNNNNKQITISTNEMYINIPTVLENKD